MKRTAGDDDLVSFDPLALAVARYLHRDCALPLELDLLDEAIWKDVKILPPPRRAIEIGQGGGDAMPVNVVLGKREAAVTELGVAIVEIGDSLLGEGVAEGER